MHDDAFVHMHIFCMLHMYVCLHLEVCVCVCMYVRMYVYVYLYADEFVCGHARCTCLYLCVHVLYEYMHHVQFTYKHIRHDAHLNMHAYVGDKS
jgi:hypothetical protein